MNTRLETVEVQGGAAGEPRASVIWLHGLGADGHDFEPVVPALGLPPGLAVRFVFPHAPVRPVTINNGYRMRAWYDIVALDRRAEDEAGIRESATLVEGLIRREGERGVPPGRIVLAGFSQGGAIALHAGLRYPETLAGIIGLSCYLPLRDSVETQAHEANAETPVLLAHGTLDPMLPVQLGREARDFLHERGYDVTWHAYAMAHAVCPEEVGDIGAFLCRVLAEPAG